MKEKILLPRYKLSERAVVCLAEIAEKTSGKTVQRLRLNTEQVCRNTAEYLMCLQEVPEITAEQVRKVLQTVPDAEQAAPEDLLAERAARFVKQAGALNPYDEAALIGLHQQLWQDIAPQAGVLRTEKSGSALALGGKYGTPSAKQLPQLLKMLLKWGETGKKSPAHPLVQAAVMGYALEVLQPFSVQTRSVSLFWMWLLLVKWRPALMQVSFFGQLKAHQDGYEKVLKKAAEAGKADAFIEFLLEQLRLLLEETPLPEKQAAAPKTENQPKTAPKKRGRKPKAAAAPKVAPSAEPQPEPPSDSPLRSETEPPKKRGHKPKAAASPEPVSAPEAEADVKPDAASAAAPADEKMQEPSESVRALLKVLEGKTLSTREMLEGLGLKHRPSFRDNYLLPALALGLVEMTIPDKPNSSLQKYRCTAKK